MEGEFNGIFLDTYNMLLREHIATAAEEACTAPSAFLLLQANLLTNTPEGEKILLEGEGGPPKG